MTKAELSHLSTDDLIARWRTITNDGIDVLEALIKKQKELERHNYHTILGIFNQLHLTMKHLLNLCPGIDY